MEFSSAFVYAGQDFTTYDRFVPSPYFRKTFLLGNGRTEGRIRITGLGFYRLWINGKEITKGLLAPYISNPDDIVYFDEYDLTPYLAAGKNVLGVQLGNGLINAPGGSVWDFDLARWRGAPRFAFYAEIGGLCFEADPSVRTAPSPLYFDDLRCGARYDARREIPGWNDPAFDDSGWMAAIPCEPPRGEYRLCEAPAIRVYKTLPPVSVRFAGICDYTPTNKRVPKKVFNADPCIPDRCGWLYDFGENNAGTVRMKIRGRPGQRVELQYAETLIDGDADYQDIQFYPEYFGQRDVYICRGTGEEEVFVPAFTYHGFRYCVVLGITEEQATPSLLTFLVATSDQPAAGGFTCGNETLNTLYGMCEISDRANFYYFPTDCPQREKNGWTGDAQLSAEHMLTTIRCRDSLIEWLRNVRRAQREDGCLPGIVPTNHWGYDLGPSWDAVITELPYQIYVQTGDLQAVKENAAAMLRYLHYAAGQREADGLIRRGLSDWCPIGGTVKVTAAFTLTLAFMDSAEKAAFLFETLGEKAEAAYAAQLAKEARESVTAAFVSDAAPYADTGCQTALALALHHRLFSPETHALAAKKLIADIHANGGFMDVGILGARVLFHVLADLGETALAVHMIARPEFPSYGHFIERGFTAIPEAFADPSERNFSLNHHMFCDIKSFFIQRIAGIWYNPDGRSPDVLRFAPSFGLPDVKSASAWRETPQGKVYCRWEDRGGSVDVHLTVPDGMRLELCLPAGYADSKEATAQGCIPVFITETGEKAWT
ncbi:MAG: family 78 glycoside hydrolase catalytic domain [Clostridia bacterium]|nr:family 78 glycoside hydrolase catalytic domain [Clostridia bacterium]